MWLGERLENRDMRSIKTSELVLVIADDDLDIRTAIARYFRGKSARVYEAGDGECAVELVRQHRPHAVVLDVMMPRMNGWEVSRHLRGLQSEFVAECCKGIGILMLTAVGPKLNELTSPMYGADAYLNKPFEVPMLEQVLRRVVHERCGLEVQF